MAEQKYVVYDFKPGSILVCNGCGSVVIDMGKHDRFHNKTRGV